MAQLKPERLVQPKIRKAFPDTAYWVADMRTGSSGQATVQVRLSRRDHFVARHHAWCDPGHQGRQRGKNTIVRKNIMVRLVVPRFFRRGDEITLSTIVQNYLPTDKTAQVSMQFDGCKCSMARSSRHQRPHSRAGKVDYRVRCSMWIRLKFWARR